MIKDINIGLSRKKTYSNLLYKDLKFIPHKQKVELLLINGVEVTLDSRYVLNIVDTSKSVVVSNESLPIIFIECSLNRVDLNLLLGSRNIETPDNVSESFIHYMIDRRLNPVSELSQLNITNVADIVCRCCNVTIEDLKSKGRDRSFTVPRHFVSALAREFVKDPDMPLNKITQSSVAEFLGKDHSTIVHSEKFVKSLKGTESELEKAYNKLRKLIKIKVDGKEA